MGKRDTPYQKAVQWEQEGLLKKAIDCYLTLSEAYLQKREPEKAISMLKRAIGCDPKFPLPLIKLGNILNAEGNFTSATKFFKEGALLAIKDGQWEQAFLSLLRAREGAPNDFSLLLLLAHVSFQKGGLLEANGYLQEVLTLNVAPEERLRACFGLMLGLESGALFSMAENLKERGYLREALAIALHVFRTSEKSEEAVRLMTDILREMGKLHVAEALVSWRKKETSFFYTRLLDVEIATQERLYGKAKEICREILKEYPENPEVLKRLNELDTLTKADVIPPKEREISLIEERISELETYLMLEGEGSERIPAGLMPIEPLEGDLESCYCLGIAFIQMRCFEEAFFYLNKVSMEETFAVQSLPLMGMSLRELGKHKEAIALLEKLLRDCKLDQDAELAVRYELALAYLKEGDTKQADFHFRMIEQIDAYYRRTQDYVREMI